MQKNPGGESSQMSPKQIISVIIAVVIGGIMLGYIFPIGLNAINDADTSNWTAAQQDIWEVLPIFMILVPLMVLAGWVYKSYT